MDITARLDQIRSIQPNLERDLNCPLELVDPAIYQDGSLLTSLELFLNIPQLDSSEGPKLRLGLFGFDFSSFGALVAVRSAVKFPIFQAEEIEAAVASLEARGFDVVPDELLSSKYSGKHSDFASMTWEERFFSDAF